MAAQLNIKDAEAVRLAKELGARSGRSATAVIRQALEREWAMQEDIITERIRRAKELSAEFRKNMPPEWHNMNSKQIMDSIYNLDDQAAE